MKSFIHILHLEDDTRDAELVQATLQSAEIACQITRVQSREDFTQAIHQGEYDLILADYHLPDYDGMSALRLVQERCPEMPFIFVSGVLGEDAAIEALTQGASDYVLKHKLARLAPAVTRALREAENRNERQRAEVALRDSEARYRRITEAITDYMYTVRVVEGQAVETRHGPGCLAVTGYSTEEFAADPYLWIRMVVADDRPVVQEQARRVLAGEPAPAIEHRIVRKDEAVRWVCNTPVPRRDGQGVLQLYDGLIQDITERKQAERDLQRSNDLLRAIIEAAPTAIIGLDLDGHVQMVWNPAAEKMLGWSAQDVMGRPLPSVPVESQEEFRRFREWIRSGKTLDGVEVRRQKRDGSPIEYSIYASPLHDAEGRIIGNVAVLVDITERKRMEEALQNSQEQLALIIDTLPALLGYVDSEQQYLYVNQRYADWYGASKEELVGKHLKEVVYEKSYQGIVKHVQAVLQGQEVSFENISYDLEGQLRAVRATYVPHFDENGQVKAFLGLVQDITEQKRAEEALRDSEERYRAIFEQAADSIVLVDVETGALTEFNDRAHKNLGYTREEFEKLKIPDFEIIESAEEVAKHIEKILKEGTDIFETKHRTKGGEIRDILVSSRAISISGRDLAQSIWKDITDRKRAEEQLKKSLKEKEVLLQELYHRTKNNMNVIGAMLSMQAEDLDDQRLTRILEEIKQRILSMAMVHEQLYNSQDLSHVNLRAYTEQLADSLLANYRVGSGNIALKVEIEPIVVLIETAIPYGLIINELMTNALRYAFPDDRDGEIRIALRRLPGEKELELWFCDNGIGLPEDLDIRKTPSFGMKLITLLVDLQFKGTVDVQVNNGTEFRIRFQELDYKARV